MEAIVKFLEERRNSELFTYFKNSADQTMREYAESHSSVITSYHQAVKEYNESLGELPNFVSVQYIEFSWQTIRDAAELKKTIFKFNEAINLAREFTSMWKSHTAELNKGYHSINAKIKETFSNGE